MCQENNISIGVLQWVWGYIMGVGLENFLTLLSQTKTTNHNRNIQSNYILLASKEQLQDPNQDTIWLLSSRALSGEVFGGTQGVRGRSAWVGDHSLVEMSGYSRFLDNMIHIGQDTYCWPRQDKEKTSMQSKHNFP